MRKLLRHEIKSNLQLGDARDSYLSLSRGPVSVSVCVCVWACYLAYPSAGEMQRGKSPTDIQQMHVRNKENSSLFQARRLSNRAMSMSMSMRGLPTATVCVCECVYVHREGTCSVPQKRNRKRRTANEAAMIATFSSFFLWLRLINEHREKCDQM